MYPNNVLIFISVILSFNLKYTSKCIITNISYAYVCRSLWLDQHQDLSAWKWSLKSCIFLLIKISPPSSEQGFGMRAKWSIHTTSNFYLSLPVTLSSRLSKDCQTELVNLCQGRDYMIFTVQLEKEQSLLSIYPARQQLSIIFCFLSF